MAQIVACNQDASAALQAQYELHDTLLTHHSRPAFANEESERLGRQAATFPAFGPWRFGTPWVWFANYEKEELV